MLRRIHELGGNVDLTDEENRIIFSDVLDAFVPDGHRLLMSSADVCRATIEGGGEIRFTGLLVSGTNVTAQLQRHIYLGRRFAYHGLIRVVPRFRGNRIAPRSLVKSVGLYDRLELEFIRLRAAYSGSWFWALWGFRFEDANELARIRSHAQEIIDVLNGGVSAASFTRPIQFARLGEPAAITFDQLADLFPQRRGAYEDLAHDNGLGMHDAIPVGRAILLTGPSWYGRLDLHAADRLIFNERARRLLEEEVAT